MSNYDQVRIWPNLVSVSLIAVLEADDIVLAEIAARLNLDQEERRLAGVLQPVFGADGDVRGLVLRE